MSRNAARAHCTHDRLSHQRGWTEYCPGDCPSSAFSQRKAVRYAAQNGRRGLIRLSWNEVRARVAAFAESRKDAACKRGETQILCKGGASARKAIGQAAPYTLEEEGFLKSAARSVVRRAAEVEYGPDPSLKEDHAGRHMTARFAAVFRGGTCPEPSFVTPG